jgi:hypothetical protein
MLVRLRRLVLRCMAPAPAVAVAVLVAGLAGAGPNDPTLTAFRALAADVFYSRTEQP